MGLDILFFIKLLNSAWICYGGEVLRWIVKKCHCFCPCWYPFHNPLQNIATITYPCRIYNIKYKISNMMFLYDHRMGKFQFLLKVSASLVFFMKSLLSFQMNEMVRIVGYHIPPSCDKFHNFMIDKFGMKNRPGGSKRIYRPMTYESKLYTRLLIEEDKVKQANYSPSVKDPDTFVSTILEDLAPADVRHLVKAEEERLQCRGFVRLFPHHDSQKYLKFFQMLPYFDKLLFAFESVYGGSDTDRAAGIKRIQQLCFRGYHLWTTFNKSAFICLMPNKKKNINLGRP